MIKKYRKRPVEIEAMEFTDENKDRVFGWVEGQKAPGHDKDGNPIIKIGTLEGVMTASLGDFIIKGVAGEYYPCKPDIFYDTYISSDTDR